MHLPARRPAPAQRRRPSWSRARLFLLAAALASVAACGGGGGGGGGSAPTAAVATSLGTVSSTTSTRWTRTFHNPLGVPASVTQTSPASAPFHIDPAALPVTAPANGDVLLPLVFAPAGAGTALGEIDLSFSDGSQSQGLSQVFQVTAEAVVWQVAPAPVTFGSVLPGAHADQSVLVKNASALSAVTLTSATPPAAVSVIGLTLPLTVPAGGTFGFTVRYAPTVDGTLSAPLLLGQGDAGGPVRVDLSGDTLVAEVVTDFGVQSFSQTGPETATLDVNVPSDAISLTLEAVAGTSDTLGLGLLTGPGSKVYENEQSTGAYFWNPGTEVFDATVPNTDRSALQLVSGGGTYSFRIRRLSGTSTSASVRAIVERRPGGSTTTGTLDLNVWLANGLSVHAAGAATDTTLQAVLSRIDQILSGQGVRLGAIDYYDVTDSTYDYVTQAEFPGLLRLSSGATKTRLNLFFVIEAIGGGVVGVSGTIGGPEKNGTGLSGVMSVYGGYTTSTIGLVASHEIGHYLGLYHTVEQDGTHDFIDDTLDCPASGTNSTCPTEGGGYLMHWLAVGGTTISNGEGLVIRGHPVVRPGASGSMKPLPASEMTAQEFGDLGRLPEGWCGTCARASVTSTGR